MDRQSASNDDMAPSPPPAPQDHENGSGANLDDPNEAPLPQNPQPDLFADAPRPQTLVSPDGTYIQTANGLFFLPTQEFIDEIAGRNAPLPGRSRRFQPSSLTQSILDSGAVTSGMLDNYRYLTGDPEAHGMASPPAYDGQPESSGAAEHRAGAGDGQSRLDSPDHQLLHRPDDRAVTPPAQPAASPPAAPTAPLPPYHTPTFPPGRDSPGFVPFGRHGQASVDQGNHWPIEPELRGDIVHAEIDNLQRRPRHQRLTYREILQKYDAWNPIEGVKTGVVSSTLRGYNRRYTIPDKENRVRVPQWHEQHLRALRKAVPRATGRGGKVSWKAVRESVVAATGRPFGLAALSAKWNKLKEKGEGEDDADSSDEGSEDEEDLIMENPDDEPGLDETPRGPHGDDDEDEDGCGGAMQAPAGTGRVSRLATA